MWASAMENFEYTWDDLRNFKKLFGGDQVHQVDIAEQMARRIQRREWASSDNGFVKLMEPELISSGHEFSPRTPVKGKDHKVVVMSSDCDD
ncbi:hypothetical protein C5167_010458 [Papaver somniferum]|uniref:Uncharacterized protein n=1 Tax=Papaver somniferum TaxID=3469 RepID=A0A4Y7K4C6_PAPSO|nr:hypothetical protein C5167_010458 [Papaver somniferum]